MNERVKRVKSQTTPGAGKATVELPEYELEAELLGLEDSLFESLDSFEPGLQCPTEDLGGWPESHLSDLSGEIAELAEEYLRPLLTSHVKSLRGIYHGLDGVTHYSQMSNHHTGDSRGVDGAGRTFAPNAPIPETIEPLTPLAALAPPPRIDALSERDGGQPSHHPGQSPPLTSQILGASQFDDYWLKDLRLRNDYQLCQMRTESAQRLYEFALNNFGPNNRLTEYRKKSSTNYKKSLTAFGSRWRRSGQTRVARLEIAQAVPPPDNQIRRCNHHLPLGVTPSLQDKVVLAPAAVAHPQTHPKVMGTSSQTQRDDFARGQGHLRQPTHLQQPRPNRDLARAETFATSLNETDRPIKIAERPHLYRHGTRL